MGSCWCGHYAPASTAPTWTIASQTPPLPAALRGSRDHRRLCIRDAKGQALAHVYFEGERADG